MKKKLTAALAAGLMVLPFGTVNLTAEATQQYVLLGDANADGDVDIADAIYTSRYLIGRETPTAYQITAMDVNCNRVIENNDIFKMQQIEAGSISAETVYKELYTVPDNSSRSYNRHDCSDNDLTSFYGYTLSLPSSLSSIEEDERLLAELTTRGAVSPDISNIPTVRVMVPTGNNTYDVCSGFIIDSHVIATAAENIYNKDTWSFRSNDITVSVYDQIGSINLVTCDAEYLHIPSSYIAAPPPYDKQFNYGLIYVDTDLSAYMTNVGVAVDEFMNTASPVTVSGYDGSNRLLSTGYVVNHYISGRMEVETYSTDDMKGGQAYIQSGTTLSNNILSAIGIIESYDSTDQVTDFVRLTPTLLRFYKYNSYLTE